MISRVFDLARNPVVITTRGVVVKEVKNKVITSNMAIKLIINRQTGEGLDEIDVVQIKKLFKFK